MHTQVAALELGAGLHEIVVEYEQHGGMYNLRLEWAPQNGSPRPLPSHFLFHAPAEADDIQVVPRALALRTLVPIVWMTLVAAGLVWVATRITARYRIAATVVRSDPVDEAVVPNRLSVVLAGATYAFAVGMFLKNAWVTEDAYILFRSVEQVFAGNGPVWNLHERVQVFTSPLWFGLLVLSRILSADLYLNAVVLSFALWLFTLRNLQRLAPNSPAFAMSVLLCVASTAVHDYTSSGLENVLAYALITYFLLQTVRLHRDALEPPEVTRTLFRLCLAFGLISVTRHDLVLLLLPPAAFAVWSHRRLMNHGAIVVLTRRRCVRPARRVDAVLSRLLRLPMAQHRLREIEHRHSPRGPCASGPSLPICRDVTGRHHPADHRRSTCRPVL